MTTAKKKLLIVLAALVVAGGVVGGGLYLAYPVQVSTIAGLSRNFIITLGSPAGKVRTESNPAYQNPVPAASLQTTEPASNPAATDWPSYNRTAMSQRYSPVNEINTTNVGRLKVLCTYDLHELAAFESGLIMVDNALIGTTEFDIFSLDPATCAVNWRTHEDYPPSLLPSNRGAAYMDGMLYRGTQDGRVLAYDFKTGKRLWADDDCGYQVGRVGALGSDRRGWPRLCGQFGRRLQGRQGTHVRPRWEDRARSSGSFILCRRPKAMRRVDR